MTNPCCALCKGAHGICLSRYQCDHHKRAEAQEDADHRARTSGRRDPTADRAIANVMRARRNPKRPRT